jgi:purine-binding chemotaxis protein CheW
MQRPADSESLGIEDTQEDLFLTFLMGDDVFGIGISYVKEIIGILPITVIPEFPDHIKGVINLRGKIIPVMDVRLRFRRAEKEYDARTCIIVVDIQEVSIGLIVDRVAEVVAIPESEIAAPPEINKREVNYIKGFGKVGGEIKILLDCDVLLGDEAEVINQKKGYER